MGEPVVAAVMTCPAVAVPVFGGAAARRRWRKASALTAAELMAAPWPSSAPTRRSASPITDPKKKWAVVFCALEGSSPDSSVVRKQLGRGGDVGVIRSS
jgi:hypothetical protein